MHKFFIACTHTSSKYYIAERAYIQAYARNYINLATINLDLDASLDLNSHAGSVLIYGPNRASNLSYHQLNRIYYQVYFPALKLAEKFKLEVITRPYTSGGVYSLAYEYLEAAGYVAKPRMGSELLIKLEPTVAVDTLPLILTPLKIPCNA